MHFSDIRQQRTGLNIWIVKQGYKCQSSSVCGLILEQKEEKIYITYFQIVLTVMDFQM